MQKTFLYLSLFTSLSTLTCCALPALFVTLGFGAAFAGIIGNVPQLIWLSENKNWIFTAGAILLTFGGIFNWRSRQMPCPADLALADACATTKDRSHVLYLISLGLYTIGAFFAFAAPLIFKPS